MKVVFIGHLGEVSGAGMALLQWAALCQQNGWECCAALPEGPIHDRAAELGVRTTIYPLARMNFSFGNSLTYYGKRKAAHNFLLAWLRNEKPDWAIVHSSANVLAGAAIRAAGIACLWHMHEEFGGSLGVRPRFKRWEILGTADRLAFASESGMESFNPPDKIPCAVLRNPVENLSRLLALDREPTKPPQILFNGISHRKGTDRFLQALEYLSQRNPELEWRAVILGKVDSVDKFHQQITAHAKRLGDRIQFAGLISSKTMERCFTESTVAVSASRVESLPIFLVESLAAGVPVIATTTGDCAKLLRDGQLGTLVKESNDTEIDLGTALYNVLEKKESRADLPQKAISDDYEPTRIFQSLRDLLVRQT